MANKNLISTTELIRKATEIIKSHQVVLDQAAESYQNLVNSAKLPSNYVSNLKSQKDSLDAINKSTQQLEKTEKQLQKERLAELRLQKKREQAFDRYDKQLEREQKRLQRTQGLYNQVQQRVNKLTREYNDLAAKKALNGKLTRQEASSLEFLEKQLNKYQGVLKKVDANIGKYQRNVGNYASGYDGLGNSIAQIGREMPAFANSVQTGFMAISNNLPIFFDEIQRTKNEIKALRAEGKQTRGLMSRLASSFLSFQTLLNVGVVLLTVYGSELVDLAFGASAAEKAQKELNTELAKSEAEAKKASKEIETLSKIVLDTTRNEVQRNEALKALNEIIPETTKFNLDLLDANNGVNEANKEFISLTSLYAKAAIARAKADIFAQKAAAKEIELSEKQTTSVKEQIKWYEKLWIAINPTDGVVRAAGRLVDEQNLAKESIDFLNQSAEDQLALALELEQGLQGVGNSTRTVKKETKETKKEVDYLKASFKDYTEEFEKILDSTSQLGTDGVEDVEKWSDALTRSSQLLRNLRKETEAYLGSFSNDFINSNPLGSLSVFFDGTYERLQAGADTSAKRFGVAFNAISESAQQTFAFIDQLGQSNFQAQYERLEQQKNVALQFAGENAEARAEIEEQFEARQRVLQRRQAEQQKKSAIFNVLIDTAQAIVATLVKTPPPAGLPLASLMAGIGAAQLAVIQSQEVPAFWQGTESAPGGKVLVNDDPYGVKGSNYKEVIEKPSGKILTPQGKNVKMNLPKGTKIHPTYGSFLESLNNRLTNEGIAPFAESAKNNALVPFITKETGLTKDDLKQVIGGLENTIKNQPGMSIQMDENGFRKYLIKGHGRTKLLNNKIHKKSRRFGRN